MTAELSPSTYPAPAEGTRLPDCDFVVILQNEHASSAEQTQAEIDKLQEIANLDWNHGKIKFMVIKTEEDRQTTIDNIGITIEEIRKRKPDAKIGAITAGGDHTQNIGLESAMQFGIDVVGLFEGGNVNALARMTNPKRYSGDMQRLIRFGETAPLHPVMLGVTPPGQYAETQLRRFFAFFGAGISANVALEADSDEHREKTANMTDEELFRYEAGIAIDIASSIDPLIIEDENGNRRVLDFSIVVGPKIAKALWISRNPLNAARAAVMETAFPDSGRKTARLAKMAVGIASGGLGIYDRITLDGKPREFRLRAASVGTSSFHVHIEGQPELLPNNTSFTASIDPRVVTVQTNRARLVHGKK